MRASEPIARSLTHTRTHARANAQRAHCRVGARPESDFTYWETGCVTSPDGYAHGKHGKLDFLGLSFRWRRDMEVPFESHLYFSSRSFCQATFRDFFETNSYLALRCLLSLFSFMVLCWTFLFNNGSRSRLKYSHSVLDKKYPIHLYSSKRKMSLKCNSI